MARFILALVIGSMIVGCGGKGGTGGAPGADAKKTYTRDELKKLLLFNDGKTVKNSKYCLEVLGPPERTVEGSGYPIWTYKERSIDEISQKKDSSFQVHFGFNGQTISNLSFDP